MEPSFMEVWNEFVSLVRTIWGLNITEIDGDPIRVSNVVIALVCFSFGLLFSKRLSNLIRDRLLTKIRLDRGGRDALHTVSYYLLIIFFTLAALKFAHVPLTIFTLAGGALAIGIGFGSQNLVNNFISGLILLIERPIRTGDMIEVQNTYGQVIHIGPRCTHVRTFTNVDILVPNSFFLENNLVNWTLTDDKVRTNINVGVAYGSPTEQVRDLIHKAVTEHEKVLKNPEPIILFEEFGDNALNFQVHFWLKMRVQMDRRRIASDIRYRIDELFREADITIAFPQRDVHIETLRPLEVSLIDTPKKKTKTN